MTDRLRRLDALFAERVLGKKGPRPRLPAGGGSHRGGDEMNIGRGDPDYDRARLNVPMILRCRLGFHRWSVWSAPFTGQQSILGRKWEDTSVQERRCHRCNKVELRCTA
jgi:hypothetical protein